jgi:hypothetical protein
MTAQSYVTALTLYRSYGEFMPTNVQLSFSTRNIAESELPQSARQ